FVSLVPTQLRRLLDSAEDARALRGFHTVLLGGGPIDPALRARAAQEGVRVVATYGSAETAGGCVYDGMPLDGVGVAIGRDGRIRLAGPTLFACYEGDPELTAEVLVDGWLKTGDLGCFDAEGYLYIVDRVKDMIIRGGLNIYTAQVEQVIARMPEVEEVAVIGVEEATWGQEVLAVVKVKAEETLEEQAVIAFCKEHLAAFKCPRFVRFMDELPKTAIGKVRKHELLRLYGDIADRKSRK
ncbi:MAG: long-chain fatty acid--CoA ligase, partial [Candidatus Hydrogenedens sp.]|nr:long-chain fatty acid--CoA ligase [Candidatus Hydrogenedens sp.]